jgi:PAP2 superfamily
MKQLLVCALLWFTSACAWAQADLIAQWNKTAIAAGYQARLTLVPLSRNVALVQVGMFEAVNAITPRYQAYKLKLGAAPQTSPEVAAATVAHSLLVQLYPDQAKTFDARYAEAMASAPQGAARDNGMAFGKQVAAEMLALRKDDNVDAIEHYQPVTRAGVYVPTVVPLGSTCSLVTPWAIRSVSQFRPSAPYAVTSAAYAQDLNEVQSLGGKTSAKRSPEQAQVAKFWEFTGPGTFSPIAHAWAAHAKLDLLDNARFFALFAMATADSYLAVFDAKYEYNFWRPFTAIRNAEVDDNRLTTADYGWLPYIDTPLHPEYPCAHCIASTTAAGVLTSVFGSASLLPVDLVSPTAPGVIRRFANVNDYVSEVLNARVWGGIHYRASTTVGKSMGEEIARYVVSNTLLPK